MDEISSLDSFHTDGGDSMPRPDSSDPSKVDEEPTNNPAAETSTTDAPIDSSKDVGDADNIDEEFEQISEGTFEGDDNSRATSAGPPLDEGTQEKPHEDPEEVEEVVEAPEDEAPSKEIIADDEKQMTAEATVPVVEKGASAPAASTVTDESADFEEVDAHVSASGHATVADESDMLGESDMTLPTDADALAEEEEEAGEKSANAMEVDNEEEEGEGEEQEAEAVATPGDVEMASVSNSPEEANKEASKLAENEPTPPQHDESMEAEAVEDEVVEDEAANTSKDVVDTAEEEAVEKDATENEADVGESSEKDKETVDAADNDATEASEVTEIVEDEEVEHEDEPVENVQEPEESDICLIPDDTETQMTEAEKEQAILARENAEKEDEEAQAEKEKEAEAAKETQAAEGEVEKAAAEEENADAEAQAVEAGAEASSGSSEAAPAIDAAEVPDPDEPLLEEMQTSVSGEVGVIPKIIIAWIVSSTQKCRQCDVEKACGFRFKNPETSEFEYVCEQSCCDAILSAHPGKYFIRRKKFLVEEVSNETTSAGSAATVPETSTAAEGKGTDSAEKTASDSAKSPEDVEVVAATGSGSSSAVAPKTQVCLQCKETKTCKYFFKQDDESFYICNDDCFNLLNAEEPDKFKLKRHSIRVRNIGATTISAGAASPAKKALGGPESRVVARTATEAEAARLERVASFTRRCADCFTEITLGDKNLLWETMDFCNEICLGKYQRTIGANCQTCHGDVPHQALGKYCVRFGFDIRQFCCATCLNEFKKGLKTCSCCQKDISSGIEGFLAPVGDKEQFKDFCSQACMRRYDTMCNPKKKLRNDDCAVCNNDKPVRVEIMLDDKEHNFCSNPCFSAFKFVSNIVADQCGMCCKYFERKGAESFTIYTERRAKVFCTRVCLNVYIIVNRRIVSCQWCKVKKYNFDMIYKQQDAQEILMCSLNCLTLYGVSINAFSRTVAKCDNCNNSATPQYHLTMSDASMRNFCTYQCVMQFQSQFARAPLTLESEAQPSSQQQPIAAAATATASKASAPFPTGLPKRVKLKMGNQVTTKKQQQSSVQIKLPTKNNTSKKVVPTVPVISTVSSLASGETETMIGSVTVRRSRGRGRKLDSPPPPPLLTSVGTTTTGSGRGRPRKTIDYARSPSPVSMSPPRSSSSKRGGAAAPIVTEKITVQTETKIIAVPPYPPAVRNVQTSCKPQTVSVGFQCEPTTATVGTQTGKDYSNKILIPVPVPIYIPQPMYMYSAPFPVPVPIPLPIPVPIFIPTTRNSSQGILKEIKKIQDKMPADPFEAELLMMAEMVAEEKRESDSDSDDEIKPDPGVVSMQYGNNVQQQQQVEVANNSYGEDVLQMALKMATGEYDQPTVDLESAMTANTITNPPPGMVGHDDSMSHMSGHMQQQPQHHMMEAQRGGRGRKRGALASPVSPRNNRSPVKRQRIQDMDTSPQPPQQMQPTEKPDANMCLKYTFGVNAWKQWVMTKNADIEKSSIRRRTFKTELLQMTADELNYSLCLFVKEVRKPNGTEYAPDTIYYLVLGIQQYLYENGRIDNIFTDPYYERFTDCLDEVARKFSVLYNDSQYIVTRVEEEHLWECKQLGAHSPHVLLSTLMFFNTKHFNLTTVEEHMQLSFSHIMKHWKRSAQNAKTAGTRNVLLRFYPPQAGLDANPRKKKVYEQQENEENPLRCPVRLYEFYLSKCPESVKTRNDVFYLQPERSCVPDSPVWYSTQALSQDALQKMLHRVKMVKEINIALLTS